MLNSLTAKLEEAKSKGHIYLDSLTRNRKSKKLKHGELDVLNKYVKRVKEIEQEIKEYGKGITWEVKGQYYIRKNIAADFTVYYNNVLQSELETLINIDIQNVKTYTTKKIVCRKPLYS